MTDSKLQEFVDNYSVSDFDTIKIVWNGKSGADFEDENGDFRMEVCEYIIPQIQTVKLELLRDLYCEIGKSSKMIFGIYLKFGVLGQELLERGGTKYFFDYIKGASHSMDAGLMSGNITLSKSRAKELLDYFEERKQITTDEDEKRLLNDFIKRRLEYQLTK